MAKKSGRRGQSPASEYSRPTRALTPAQEAALATGELSPVLAWAAADARRRLEIRAASFALYHRGVSLGRVSGDGPFVSETDAVGDRTPVRGAISSGDEAHAFVEMLAADCSAIDERIDSGASPRNHRSFIHALAAGNTGADPAADDVVAVDLEHGISARRRVDIAALLRSPGVSGPGGFATPSLLLIDVRTPEKPLSGSGGPGAVAADIAEFAKAGAGESRRRSCEEVVSVAAQRARLGLLGGGLEVQRIAEGLPWFLVAFCEVDVASAACDTAVREVHDRLVARHHPTERLLFAHVIEAPESGDGLTLAREDLMSYRDFKAYRSRLA